MDIYKLVQNRDRKSSYKEELFPKILKQCHRRIEYSNNLGDLFTIFTIPDYVFGYPRFNKMECMEYLILNLSKNGFKVESHGEHHIYISWNHVYEQYKEDKLLGKNLLEDVSNPKVELIDFTVSSDKRDDVKMDKINNLIFNKKSKYTLLE